jgi:hypothetical protein
MMGGFALVAYPAQYGVSGIMSFIVNQDGVVYQKNLGAKTAALGLAMKEFNPGSTWTKVSLVAPNAHLSVRDPRVTRILKAPDIPKLKEYVDSHDSLI